MLNIKIKLIENGKMPEYKRNGDCCLDCYARKEVIIPAGKRKLIELGFAIELPPEWEGIVRPRSGLSKAGIDVAIGSIDSNYRGEVMANVINNSGEDFKVEIGNRICQLAIRTAPTISFELVNELSDTNRGSDGFGSSGK